MSPSNPKTLLFDIETSHNLAAVFQLYGENNYISPENIWQERFLICASWRWLGEKKIHSVSILDDPKLYKKDPHNDLHVVRSLHDVLSSADVIIGHNSDKFDIKFAEARMLIQGLPPLPPITKIDTLKVAKDRFLFNSNSLDYLGTVLKVGRKKPTTNGLWLRVLNGDESAINEMVKYNKQDVELLERVFTKLRPYIANHTNRELFGGTGCPRCGSLKYQSRGIHRAITRIYQRYCCNSCGGWFRELKAEKKSTTKRVL